MPLISLSSVSEGPEKSMCPHPDDCYRWTTDTPGFKPFIKVCDVASEDFWCSSAVHISQWDHSTAMVSTEVSENSFSSLKQFMKKTTSLHGII